MDEGDVAGLHRIEVGGEVAGGQSLHHHRGRRAVVDRYGEPFGQRRCGHCRHLDDLDAFLRQPIELATDRVKLAVRRD